MRVMEQFIAKLCRRAALEKVSNKRFKKFAPTVGDLEKILGSKRFETDMASTAANARGRYRSGLDFFWW